MNPPKYRAALVAGLLSFLPALPAVAAPAPIQWFVTTARATGYRGEEFYTSLRFVNSSRFDAPLRLTFVPQTPLDASGSALGGGASASTVGVVIPAGQKVVYPDALALFGRSRGVGAIRVVSSGTGPQGEPLPVSATSMTMTLVGNPQRFVTGPLIPALGPDALVAAGESATVPMLWLGGSTDTESYRSNIFLLSANAESNTVVRLTLVDFDNVERGSREITLGPLAQTQINSAAAFFGYVFCANGCPSDDPYFEEVRVTVSVSSGGPIAVGGAVIDGTTGVSFYVPAVKVPAP